MRRVHQELRAAGNEVLRLVLPPQTSEPSWLPTTVDGPPLAWVTLDDGGSCEVLFDDGEVLPVREILQRWLSTS